MTVATLRAHRVRCTADTRVGRWRNVGTGSRLDRSARVAAVIAIGPRWNGAPTCSDSLACGALRNSSYVAAMPLSWCRSV